MLNSLSTFQNILQYNNVVPNPPVDNLLVYLQFKPSDVSSSTLKNYGTLGDFTTYGQNTFSGNIITFGGNTNSYLQCVNTIILQPQNYTICFYVKNNRTTSNYTNFCLLTYTGGSTGFTDAIILEAENNGSDDVFAVNNKYLIDNSVNYTNGNIWLHICAVFNFTSTSITIKYYLNGKYIKQSIVNTPTSYTGSRTFYISKATWDANQFIQGQMRGYRMYSRELNPQEIMGCYTYD